MNWKQTEIRAWKHARIQNNLWKTIWGTCQVSQPAFLPSPGKPRVFVLQGTQCHRQWNSHPVEGEGTRDDKSGEENAASAATGSSWLWEFWLFGSSWWEEALWGRKEKWWRRGGECSQSLPASTVTCQGNLKAGSGGPWGIKRKNFSILQPGCDSKESYTAPGLVRQTLSTHVFGFLLIICEFVKSRDYPSLSEKY